MSKANDIKMLKALGFDVKAVKRLAKLLKWMQERGAKFDPQYLEQFPLHERNRIQNVLTQAKLMVP